MQKLAILTLVLALAAAKFVDTHASLAQIDSNPFGNVVLSAIKAHLQAQTPANEVNMLLNGVAAGLQQDQNDHDHAFELDTTTNNRIVEDLEKEILYHQNQISSNTQLRDDTIEALAVSEEDIRVVIQDIATNEQTYAREEATRNQQHETFVSKIAAIDDVIDAIDEAAKLIQHLSLGASFVQVKSKYETVHKRLTDNTSHSQLLQPVVVALTELATHGVNQKALTKIAQLLSEIRQQLVSEKAAKTDVEERQAAHWAEFSVHLSNEHTRLVERKAQLEVQIQEQKDTIEDAQSWIEFHTLELENSEERLAGQQAWYAVQSEIYETQTAERAAQNEIVDRLQEHISEKLSTTAQFISKRN
ncbi:unnamed protein product [Paramecium sonneborni]|uniref:Trichocyst matrix protein n=1 Tax=Paramecium sonneborni TaxID=65129 RepID=A0A8S1MTU0_9CILI|nr:unnamed protein product [Paramecium sonneborni]CAD8081871.1 unnamed protein product [Paramecium sonneborni]